MKAKEKEMTINEHLSELRRVLIVSFTVVVVFAIGCYAISDEVMRIILSPVTNAGYKPVVTTVTEAFATKIKLSLFLGFLCALPVVLWQVWSFIAPALGRPARRHSVIFVLGSFLLFVGGVLFGFFGVYKYGVVFLLKFAGPDLVPMLTIGKYVSFTIYFLVPFGIMFELPLVSLLLAQLGLVSSSFLVKNRKFAFLAIVILAAIITPTPDAITCLLMTGPIYALYEISVVIVRLTERSMERKRVREEMQEASGGREAASLT